MPRKPKVGYDPKFLGNGIEVPLPDFAPWLKRRLVDDLGLTQRHYEDFLNFSVAVDGVHRAPVVAALNADVGNLKSQGDRPRWRHAEVLGADHVIDDPYYRDLDGNSRGHRFNRGHLAPFATAAWGTDEEAELGAEATMVFANAAIQDTNHNNDEWKKLERWIRAHADSGREKPVATFTGPIFGRDPLFVVPTGRAPAKLPGGFFKVFCFLDADLKLAVRAFIVPQSRAVLADQKGKPLFDDSAEGRKFQVTIATIERLTGLKFHKKIAKANPLFETGASKPKAALNVPGYPEVIPVDAEGDIVDPNGRRVAVETGTVFIAGVMPKPSGGRRERWISIVNLGETVAELNNWSIADGHGHTAKLSGRVQPGAAMKIEYASIKSLRLRDENVVLSLYDDKKPARRVDRKKYRSEDVAKGRPIVFGLKALS